MSKSLIFAHRGANTEAAENTRTAFECSLSHEIDGIETDVQLSRDQIAVLWHDRFLNKLGLPDKRIDDFDFATLREMNFSAHFPGAKPEGILSLSEFFEAYRRRCRRWQWWWPREGSGAISGTGGPGLAARSLVTVRCALAGCSASHRPKLRPSWTAVWP